MQKQTRRRYDLSDDPRLVLVAPRSPTTRSGEHLKPMNRLSDSITTVSILSLTVIRAARLAGQDIFGKVTAGHRLQQSVLVFGTPTPPAPSTGENFQPAHRLRDSIMFSAHSKPSG